MLKLILTKTAEKELTNLPLVMGKRLARALDELMDLEVRSSNVKKLQLPFSGYRKRVRDYRVLFEINNDILLVYRIDKRSNVYR